MSTDAHILDPFRYSDFSPETLQAANNHFEGAQPAELVTAVADLNPWILSSFGFQAAALFCTVQEAEQNFPTVFINTGFEHPETVRYVGTLSRYFALNVTVVHANPWHVRDAREGDYYRTDLHQFNEITKHEPLKRFLDEYDTRILLGGLRRAQGHGSDQVAVRAGTQRFQLGPQGELRINPNVDMTDEAVRAIFAGGVPQHPLRDQYLGDRLPLTVAPQDVEKPDCRINLSWNEPAQEQAS